MNTDELERALDAFVTSVGDAAPGVLLRVSHGPSATIWTGVRGVRNLGGEPIQPTDCFRVASVAKTFTAATLLLLVEDGHIAVDMPVTHLLNDPIRSLLDAVEPGVREQITIERLLNHTSGLHDFGRDDEFMSRVGSDPQHEWTATELIDLSMRRGPMAGVPGERFHYSDTGFTLLASVVEQVLGAALPAAYRWMLARAGLVLEHTWLEGRESAPDAAPARVHQYLGGADTFELDPSCDTWGGGGLVSTCADLAAFADALFSGRILRSRPLLDWMLSCDRPTDLGAMGQFSGRGIFRTPVLGVDRYGHEGFWGVWMHHYPDLGVTVTGTHTGVPVGEEPRRRLFEAPVLAVSGGAR